MSSEHKNILPQVSTSLPAAETTALSFPAKNITPASEKNTILDSLMDSKEVEPEMLSIQAKLIVGSVDDPLEKEADFMANQVMRIPESNFIQRKCNHCEEEETLHRKSITPFIQKRTEDTQRATSNFVTNEIEGSKGNGNSLPENTKSFMENRFSVDFSEVNIHTDNTAVQLSRELNAQAFTVGNDIYFNENRFNPNSDSGKHLLAHELTHTIQQSGGQSSSIQRVISCTSREAMLREIERCRNALDVTSEASMNTTLVCLGIRADMVGNTQTITTNIQGSSPEHTRVGRSLSEAERIAAFDLLITLIPGGGLFGNCNRIISSWNARKDDLGPSDTTERGKYPTILHYMRELTFLGSGGNSTTDASAYPTAIRDFPMITLAGATSGSMHVHPRNVYFVASAQVRMDIRSGLEETISVPGTSADVRIHYIAPGGVSRQLRVLRRQLQTIKRTPRRGRTVPVDHLEKYNSIIGQVLRLRAIMEQQVEEEQETTTGDESSHSEHSMRAWFTSNASFFDNLDALTDVSLVPSNATALHILLGSVPRFGSSSPTHHGFGAVDPHGTDHAMGFAIDLFNATTGVNNMGLKQEYLPFVNFVVDNFTHSYESGGESRVIDFRGGTRITGTQQLPPDLTRDLSILLQEKGQQAYDGIISQREAAAANVGDRTDLRRDTATISSVRRSLNRFIPRLRTLLARPHTEFREDENFSRLIGSLLTRIRYHSRVADSLSPEQLNNLLAQDLDDLNEILIIAQDLMSEQDVAIIRNEIQTNVDELSSLTGRRLNRTETRRRSELQRENRRLGREASRLDSIFNELEALDITDDVNPTQLESASATLSSAIANDNMQERYEARRIGGLIRIIDNRGFRNWLNQVIRHGIYTQPPLMVNSINDVRSFRDQENMVVGEEFRHTHFQGGHHWQIAPRSIITDNTEYLTALRRDMSQRSVSDLQRIVRTINEWDQAQGLLTSDTVLLTALGRSMTRNMGESETNAGIRLVNEALNP